MHHIHTHKDIDDSFQAFLVEGANFTAIEEFPVLPKEAVPNTLPIKIMPFSKAIASQADLSQTVIDTFCPDRSFERVRRNPRKYLGFFKRTAGIIGFDFSVHSDMPLVKQKSQMNDNLSLTYFCAANGVPIYPNPRGGSPCLDDEYLSAFPKGTYLALGVHGFVKEKQQKAEWYCWIKKLITTLEPKGFIVVGHLSSPIFDELKKMVPFYFYDSFIEQRTKEAKNNVD